MVALVVLTLTLLLQQTRQMDAQQVVAWSYEQQESADTPPGHLSSRPHNQPGSKTSPREQTVRANRAKTVNLNLENESSRRVNDKHRPNGTKAASNQKSSKAQQRQGEDYLVILDDHRGAKIKTKHDSGYRIVRDGYSTPTTAESVHGKRSEPVPSWDSQGDVEISTHAEAQERVKDPHKVRMDSSTRQADLDVKTKEETENTNGEIRHVFFLKVHKAASTTVMNILYRFGINRNLKVMLPESGIFMTEKTKNWTHSIMPLPKGATHFDILCCHLVFNEPVIRASLGEGTKFIGIVREPFGQFLSAFWYYRTRYRKRHLVNIPGEDPVATYLENPGKHEPNRVAISKTHNRMSFDFGMSPSAMKNETSINTYIHYLNRTFDLVMVSERFDESMVLMKRLLDWQLQDVLYIKNNVFSKSQHNYTAEQNLTHRNFNIADYRLYEHFVDLFQRKVGNEGQLFQDEVATFVSLREKVESFCRGSGVQGCSVTLAATNWSPEFEVSKSDCHLMSLAESPLVRVLRSRLYGVK